jgi:hypothetical protein
LAGVRTRQYGRGFAHVCIHSRPPPPPAAHTKMPTQKWTQYTNRVFNGRYMQLWRQGYLCMHCTIKGALVFDLHHDIRIDLALSVQFNLGFRAPPLLLFEFGLQPLHLLMRARQAAGSRLIAKQPSSTPLSRLAPPCRLPACLLRAFDSLPRVGGGRVKNGGTILQFGSWKRPSITDWQWTRTREKANVQGASLI